MSILEDVDFELELIHRDDIDVDYIKQLLAGLKDAKPEELEKKKEEIIELLTGESSLRSKRQLIEKFIAENLPHVKDAESLSDEFDKFWSEEQIKAFDTIIKEEKLSPERTQALIENYLFAEREPIRDEVLDLIEGDKPTALKRKSVGARILKRIVDFVDTFVEGVSK